MRRFLSCVSVMSVACVLFVTANAGAEAIIVASYVYDGEGVGAVPHAGPFPDTGTVELTDGLFPASSQYNDAAWVGYRDNGKTGTTSHPQVTFFLDRYWDVGTIDVTYLVNKPITIGAPTSVFVSTSGDGIAFSTPVNYTGFGDNSTAGIRTTTLDVLSLGDAKYYRLDFRNPESYTFLGEIEFNGFRSAGVTWDGGVGNWNDANWGGGKSPLEFDSVAIDAASGDSDVTLGGVWRASALSVGLYNQAKFTVDQTGGYLIVEDAVSVGADGTLQVEVDGVLAAKSLHSDGRTIIDADLEDILTLRVTGGSTSLAGGSVVNLDVADGSLDASKHLMVLQNMTIRGGASSLTGGNVANLSVTDGSLSTSADLTVSTMQVPAGTVDTMTAAVKILDNADLAGTTFTRGVDNPTLRLSGSDLLNAQRLMSFGDGTVTIAGGMDTTNTDLAATGDATLTLGTTSAVTFGSMTLDGAAETTVTISTGPGNITFDGLTGKGTLRRDGDVGGFFVEGTLAPGNSTGRMEIGGSILIAGLLEIELAGLGDGQFDQLDVSGMAMIGGATLDIELLGGYVPKGGDSFVILTAGQGIDGEFVPPTLPANWSLEYDANNVTLRVVPEPSTLLLGLTASLLGLAGLVRRRRVRV